MQITSLHSLNAFLLPIKTVGVQVQGSFQGCSGSCFPAGAACGETSLLLRGWEYRAWLRKGELTGGAVPASSCVGAGRVLGSLSRSVPGALWGSVQPRGCSLTVSCCSPPSSAVTLLAPLRLGSARLRWVKIPPSYLWTWLLPFPVLFWTVLIPLLGRGGSGAGQGTLGSVQQLGSLPFPSLWAQGHTPGAGAELALSWTCVQ